MQFRIKTHSGAVVVLLGVPTAATSTFAQTNAPSNPSAASGGAPDSIGIGDPGWFVAGFVAGLAAGVIAAKAFGGSKSTNDK
jgi:hypothetical protein